ncbi:MAG: addiction module protein [Scrofimicrobium sp.]
MAMAIAMAQVEKALMALDRREQAALLQRGIRNLNTRSEGLQQDDVEAAWRDELSKRIDDIHSGAVELLDFDESHRQIRAQLISCRPIGECPSECTEVGLNEEPS